MLALTAVLGVTGCETSSHKSVRTYDYHDEAQAPEQRPQEERDSEYHMVSPGEMVVDPGR